MQTQTFIDEDQLLQWVIANLTARVSNATLAGKEFHLALTGGSIGSRITRALGANEFLSAIEPKLLHLWWSDERLVPLGDDLRNDVALPASVVAAGCKVHHQPSDFAGAVVESSTQLHQFTTTRFCATNTLMDLTILSIGPDGHVASLFPNHALLDSTVGIAVIADSPKPPAQRITWTFPTINASQAIWLIAAGAQKHEAVSLIQSGCDLHTIPAAGVHGKEETRLLIDNEAAGLAN